MKRLIILMLLALSVACSTVPPVKQDELQAAYGGETIQGLQIPEKSLHFLVVGDWGRNGEYHQKEVAAQMGKAATQLDAAFIISTGDNFYPNGVASVSDPHWQVSFEAIYTAHSLFNDWYAVLGNHDYRGNVDAQIKYTEISRRWKMPARYYSLTKVIDRQDGDSKVLLVFMDTNPFQKAYYTDENYQSQVKTQNIAAQKKWLDSVLSNTPARWKIVVGHHPLYSAGIRKDKTQDFAALIQPILEKHRVDAYICGHEHHLEYARLSGTLHHFISGAGSKIRRVSSNENTVYAVSENGFMAFSLNQDEMRVQFINHQGKILYATKIEKIQGTPNRNG